MSSRNGILFFSANANNTLQESDGVESVDFEKMYDIGDSKYDNFGAHYFHTLINVEKESGFRAFEHKVESFGWEIHRGLDTKVTKRSYASVVDAIRMASKFYPIVDNFLDKQGGNFEQLDLIFCVFHLSYASLFKTILEDMFFYDEEGKERWVKIELLNDPGKTNPHLMKQADELVDIRALDLAL